VLQLSVAEFLADGDHVTRMLKDWGDSLDRRLPPPHRQAAAAAAAAAAAGSGVEGGGGAGGGGSIGGAFASGGASQRQMAAADVRACVTVLRCVLLLTRLAGRFIGRFLPQLMVLLAAGLRPANPREIKLQCLEGWLGLVKSLAAEAPVQLGGVVSQVVVALMDALQEGGAVTAAAMRVVEELVVVCRRNHRDKLRVIPPLPNWLPELERLNEVVLCCAVLDCSCGMCCAVLYPMLCCAANQTRHAVTRIAWLQCGKGTLNTPCTAPLQSLL
jgi:hypothetical protein